MVGGENGWLGAKTGGWEQKRVAMCQVPGKCISNMNIKKNKKENYHLTTADSAQHYLQLSQAYLKCHIIS